MNRIQELKDEYEKNEKEILNDFFAFLKFQSVSSELRFKNETRECAIWLQDYLKKLQFDTELWETCQHPVIFASNLKAGKDYPTLLIYNHYDVQPVDPLELWSSKPFEPEIRNGQIYARGAQDNKGQCFYTLQALKSLLKPDGSLPINIKLCIEGEEECGSAGLNSILKEKKDQLKADYLSVVDLGIRSLNHPSITLGIRGIVTMDVEISGSFADMHSGSNGGLLYNPNHALVELLASLRDHEGVIQIPKFYDDVVELKPSDKELISWDFDEDEYFKMFGVLPTGGEKTYLPLERNWLRPTLEINGISGGYSGSGFKTVIPSKAIAKISCRLVPNQNPETIAKLVADYLLKHTPKGVTVKVECHHGGKAAHSNPTSKVVQAFKKSYMEVFEKNCTFVYEGASIPVVTELSLAARAEVVLVGLGLPDDNIHAPNEHFGIDRLKLGFLTIARAIELLA
jgi:acetylornithine deacetylase/succinyl-diaminopimelate desuccinylase-like protein